MALNDELIERAAEGIKAQRTLDGLLNTLIERGLARKTGEGPQVTIELADKGIWDGSKNRSGTDNGGGVQEGQVESTDGSEPTGMDTPEAPTTK